MAQSASIFVARLEDGRLQVVTGDMQTRWKISRVERYAGWTSWRSFPTAGLPSYATQPYSLDLVTIYPLTALAAAQLMTASSQAPNAGRLMVFACDSEASASNSNDLGLYVTMKSSEESDAEWLPWTNPPYPVQQGGSSSYSASQVAVVPLADGRLQLWVSVTEEDGPITLYSCVQNAVAWNAPLYSNWTPFALGTTYGVAEPYQAALLNPVAASFPNNNLSQPGFQAQIWLPTNPVITSLRQSASAPAELTDPLVGWSQWSEFAALGGVPEDANLIPVQAATDGQGRTYLWLYSFNPGSPAGSGPWSYIYSLPDAPYWSTLLNFGMPEASAIGLSDQPFLTNVISAAPLPSGFLQLFYLGMSGQVWTCWQTALPSNTTIGSWTEWETF